MPKEELSLDVIKQYRVVRPFHRLRGSCQGSGPDLMLCSASFLALSRWAALLSGDRPVMEPDQRLGNPAQLHPSGHCSCSAWDTETSDGRPAWPQCAIPMPVSIAQPQTASGVVQTCPKPLDKTKVLKDMIFPLCEKLGQTIIFVRTRDSARALHHAVRPAKLFARSESTLAMVALWEGRPSQHVLLLRARWHNLRTVPDVDPRWASLMGVLSA